MLRPHDDVRQAACGNASRWTRSLDGDWQFATRPFNGERIFIKGVNRPETDPDLADCTRTGAPDRCGDRPAASPVPPVEQPGRRRPVRRLAAGPVGDRRQASRQRAVLLRAGRTALPLYVDGSEAAAVPFSGTIDRSSGDVRPHAVVRQVAGAIPPGGTSEVPPPPPNPAGAVKVCENGKDIVVTGKGFRYIFDMSKGGADVHARHQPPPASRSPSATASPSRSNRRRPCPTATGRSPGAAAARSATTATARTAPGWAVDLQYVPYHRPQEHGNYDDVR